METALYLPVKRFLEELGFTVKGEIGGCDLVGLSAGDPPVVVIGELKLAFNLELILQAVDRAPAGDEVWIAAKMSARGKGRESDARYRNLCRRLGFGMLNSGAFAANLKRVRKLYREARDVLAETLEAASDGALSVPVPSQGLHLVARFDPSVDPSVAARAKQACGAEGWLLADTYSRARPLTGFVLGFSGHAVPQLKASAERLARESRAALRAGTRATRRA